MYGNGNINKQIIDIFSYEHFTHIIIIIIIKNDYYVFIIFKIYRYGRIVRFNFKNKCYLHSRPPAKLWRHLPCRLNLLWFQGVLDGRHLPAATYVVGLLPSSTKTRYSLSMTLEFLFNLHNAAVLRSSKMVITGGFFRY